MTHKEKRIFFNWLQRQGVLKQYKHNRFAFSKKYHYLDSYKSLPFFYAIDAFIWRHTPEGYGFWLHLDHEWTFFARKLQHDT